MSEFFAIIKPERKIFVLRDGSSSFTLTSPGERETIDHDGVIYFYRGIVGGIAFYSSSEPQHDDEDVETSFEATTVLNTGVSMIDEERRRQLYVKGFDGPHDDQHTGNQMAMAALCYIENAIFGGPSTTWPWSSLPITLNAARSSSPVRNLVKAGALIAAEIDRRLRAGQEA